MPVESWNLQPLRFGCHPNRDRRCADEQVPGESRDDPGGEWCCEEFLPCLLWTTGKMYAKANHWHDQSDDGE